MLSALLALIGAIPGIGALVTSITTAVFNSKVQIATAKIGGDTAVATALVKASEPEAHERTAALSVIAGSKILLLLVVVFAAPLAIFEWKVVVYDTILGLGTTLPIRGEVAQWANLIIGFVFGAPTSLALGQMWFSRKTS